jgi:hypothetical protein
MYDRTSVGKTDCEDKEKRGMKADRREENFVQ